MRRYPLLAGAMVIAMLQACATYDITWQTDPTAQFSQFRTYAFGSSTEGGGSDLQKRQFHYWVRETVKAEMAKHGIQETTDRTPDLLVSYRAGIGFQSGWTALDPDVPDKGTMVLEMLSTSKADVVWQATAVADVEQSATEEERQSLIKKVVQAMFSKFPPGQSK